MSGSKLDMWVMVINKVDKSVLMELVSPKKKWSIKRFTNTEYHVM